MIINTVCMDFDMIYNLTLKFLNEITFKEIKTTVILSLVFASDANFSQSLDKICLQIYQNCQYCALG